MEPEDANCSVCVDLDANFYMPDAAHLFIKIHAVSCYVLPPIRSIDASHKFCMQRVTLRGRPHYRIRSQLNFTLMGLAKS